MGSDLAWSAMPLNLLFPAFDVEVIGNVIIFN